MKMKAKKYSTVVVTDIAAVNIIPQVNGEYKYKTPIWGEQRKWQRNKSLPITPGKYDTYEILWLNTSCWRMQPAGTELDVVGNPEIKKLGSVDVDCKFVLMTGDEIFSCDDAEEMSICTFKTGGDGAFRAVKFGDEFSFYTIRGESEPKELTDDAEEIEEDFAELDEFLALTSKQRTAKLNKLAPGGLPTQEFWGLWRLGKDQLKQSGVKVSKNDLGFVVNFEGKKVCKGLDVGSKCLHKHYGQGKILECDTTFAKVEFDDGSQRRFIKNVLMPVVSA